MIYRIIIKNESECKHLSNKYGIMITKNKYPIYMFLDDNKYIGYCSADCFSDKCPDYGCLLSNDKNFIDYNYFRKEKFKRLIDDL